MTHPPTSGAVRDITATHGRDGDAPFPAVVVVLLLACLLPEIVLSGADFGFWGSPRWRQTAVEYAGFWPGLLGTWRPNYPGQSVLMFASYGFLHAGLAHFAVNMLTLLSLGRPVAQRIGQARFLVLYLVSIVGGAAGFAALSASVMPMVGASGALFGLLGAILAWEFRDRLHSRAGLWPVLRSVGILVALNLVLWWAMHGLLAWQAHLGGFVAGWASGLWLDRRFRG